MSVKESNFVTLRTIIIIDSTNKYIHSIIEGDHRMGTYS